MGIHTEVEDKHGRFSSLLAEVISGYIYKNFPPGILITVSRISFSRKATTAHIFVSVFPEDKRSEMLELLNNQLGKIKADLAKHSTLRRIPNIYFELDTSQDLVAKIDEAQK